jgi:hypothetical protein
MAKKTRIDEILEQQGDDLSGLEDREVAAFLKAYEDARRELREKLAKVTVDHPDQRFTAQHMRVMLAQIEDGLRELRKRLQLQLDAATDRARQKALADLLATIKVAEPDFTDTGNRIEHAALRKIADSRGLLLHRHSVERYGEMLIGEVQRQLSVGLVSGETYTQLRDRLTAVEDSPFAQMRGRAELIVRMEMNAAYNGSHQASIESAAEILDDPDDPDPMLKKADEARDVRNHALSRVLDGMVVGPKEQFRVPQAEVAAEHAKLQAERRAKKLPERKLGGITWPLVGGFYVGLHHPAHFNDRGRIVPWRESWGEPTSAKPKPPAKPKPVQPPPAPAPPPPPPPVPLAQELRQKGLIIEDPRVKGARYDAFRDDVDQALERQPRDLIDRAAKHGWKLELVPSINDSSIAKGDNTGALGLCYLPTGQTSVGLQEFFFAPAGHGYRPGKTTLHELGHALDAMIARKRSPGLLSHRHLGSWDPFFRDWHSEACFDGTLTEFLEFCGVQPWRYVQRNDALSRMEAWAELLGHCWYDEGRRAEAERLWPGLLQQVEDLIRAEVDP